MRKLLLAFCLIFHTGILFAAPKPGILSGKVIQKTTNKSVGNTVVQLSIYKNDFQIASSRSKTSSSGQYQFRDLEIGSEFGYQVSALIKNVPFLSKPIQFTKSNTVLIPNIEIVPVTGDPKLISVQEIVLLEYGPMDILKVSHSFSFENKGTELYDSRADDTHSIETTLPDQGFEFNVSPSSPTESVELIPAKNMVKMGIQVPPKGQAPGKIEYTYLLHYTKKVLPLKTTSTFDRSKITFASLDKKISVKNPIFTEQPFREKDGKKYYLFSGGPVPANSPFEITLDQLPLSSDKGRNILFGTIALLILTAFFLIWKGKELMPSKKTPQDWKETLLQELVSIQQRWDRKEISWDEYEDLKLQIREYLFDLSFAAEKPLPK